MIFKKILLITAVFIPSLFLIACTKETVIEKQAPKDMMESFNRSATCERASCITIQKDALKKMFLLMASAKTGGTTPQWLDFKPHVISFEKSGSKIAILGHKPETVYDEIKSENLIQSFDIVSEDEKSITFDWASGLKTFIVQSPYDIDGEGLNGPLTEETYSSIRVTDSFVRNIKFDSENIELEQISKISSETVKVENKKFEVGNREQTLMVNLQIRSYNLSGEFVKKEADPLRHVGFFVTKLAKKSLSNQTTNLITKWDLSPKKGPILVRVSAAVPADFVEAIQEGAYYWNKVFGRNVLKVVIGVDPQATPQERSIFVRWISWLDAGSAYAIAQSDPFTGEILRAQVFMTSVFTKVGSSTLVQMNDNVPVAVGAVACDVKKKIAQLNNLALQVGPSGVLRLAQDSVRTTVAHELGHALGLRHNFAGTFSSKVSARQISAAAKEYLKDPGHPGLETSTSIMDYVAGIDEVLMAARIKHSALSYDKMAMNWAYSNGIFETPLDESVSKYCSDEDIALANDKKMQVYGCERFDAGNNPMLRKYMEAKYEAGNFINILFTSITRRLFPIDRPNVVNDVDAVLQATVQWQNVNISSLKFIGQFLLDGTVDSKLSPAFASLDFVKLGLIEASKLGYDQILIQERTKALAEIGGYSTILSDFLKNETGVIDIHWLENQIALLKNSSAMVHGKTLDGREYQLTPEMREKILAFFDELVVVNKKAFITELAGLIPKEQTVSNNGIGSSMVVTTMPVSAITENDAVLAANIYLELLSLKDGTQAVKVGPGLAKEVTVDQGYLTHDERLTWMNLLSSKGMRFNMEGKKALVRKFQYEKVTSFLKEVDPEINLESIADRSKLASELADKGLVDTEGSKWLTTELAVLTGLDSLK